MPKPAPSGETCWPKPLAMLRGKAICLEIRVRQAKLFALEFHRGRSGGQLKRTDTSLCPSEMAGIATAPSRFARVHQLVPEGFLGRPRVVRRLALQHIRKPRAPVLSSVRVAGSGTEGGSASGRGSLEDAPLSNGGLPGSGPLLRPGPRGERVPSDEPLDELSPIPAGSVDPLGEGVSDPPPDWPPRIDPMGGVAEPFGGVWGKGETIDPMGGPPEPFADGGELPDIFGICGGKGDPSLAAPSLGLCNQNQKSTKSVWPRS
jgi:hypothetical protein